MIFADIVMASSFEDVWNYLISEYDDHDHDNSKSSYLEAFNKLIDCIQTEQTNSSDLSIRIRKVMSHDIDDNNDEDEWWDVDGVAMNGEVWAIEFRPWSEWLSMEIEKDTLINFNPHEIVAHCLWEMTFIGFDEDEIEQEYRGIERAVEQCFEDLENRKVC